MTDDNAVVPVYTLATRQASAPDVGLDGPMTSARLSELRTVLAAMADSPSRRWKSRSPARPRSSQRDTASRGEPSRSASIAADREYWEDHAEGVRSNGRW